MLWSMVPFQADNVPKNPCIENGIPAGRDETHRNQDHIKRTHALLRSAPFMALGKAKTIPVLSGHMSTGAHHYCKGMSNQAEVKLSVGVAALLPLSPTLHLPPKVAVT